METILLGDALEQLQTLDRACIHTCVTSPPYYHLRDYGIQRQIGMEAAPEEYIERLVQVFREVRRVLRPDGTLWIVIGDTYAANGANRAAGCKPKDMIGILWLLALALRADGWYLRQDIIWVKPNAMPESVKSRCTREHEYILLLSKSPNCYFDAKAIRDRRGSPYPEPYRAGRTPVWAGDKRWYPDRRRSRRRTGWPSR